MSKEFKNATITLQANVYFDGKVNSRTVVKEDGTTFTLGFMQAGEYQFDTQKAELMEVLNGEMAVLLPNATEWETFGAGTAFSVPATSSFKVKVAEFADYCCSYLAE